MDYILGLDIVQGLHSPYGQETPLLQADSLANWKRGLDYAVTNALATCQPLVVNGKGRFRKPAQAQVMVIPLSFVYRLLFSDAVSSKYSTSRRLVSW